jgi:hypothetical protein
MTWTGAAAPGIRRLQQVVYWLAPPLFCLWVYWYGLLSWFQADDFAWLSLHQRVHNFHDLWEFLFTPMAQGTIRPLSERAFFLAFYHWFGLEALPWRVAVYLTQCVNLALLALLTRRITGSHWAGFWAAMLWTANSALATAMSWTSDYNQILCATFLLLATICWIRFVDGGRWRWFWTQVVVFTLGFGALEINVVYPALAAAYVILLTRRERWRRLLWTLAPMFGMSILYFWWHSRVAPTLRSGPYALHLDTSILRSFLIYLRWSFVPSAWASLGRPGWVAVAALVAIGFLMAALLVVRWPGRRVVWFAWAWFVITIAPILPLADHRTDYYLTIPAIGVSIALGASLRWNWKIGVPAMALYMVMMVPAASFNARWYSDRSQHVRTLVLGVLSGREKHPAKPILLDGINDELYALAIAHSPFRALGVMDVYLAPDSVNQIHAPANLVGTRDYVLPEGPTLRALEDEQLVVYRIDDEALRLGRLKNETSVYTELARQKFTARVPTRVDLGNRLDSYLAGEGWYELEIDHRWMGRSASVALGAVPRNDARLALTGYCPVQQTQGQPLQMTVSVEGFPVGTEYFSRAETPFTRVFRVPEVLTRNKESVKVRIAVNKTFKSETDSRNLGLAFGIVEWR